MMKSWTAGIEEEEKKQEVIAIYGEAIVFRQKLAQLLNKKKASNNNSSTSKAAYSSPNWPYLQADAVGYERAINEVINLIGIDEVSNTEVILDI